jgi:pyruvate ferredoxin oxidoreductase gamma subunit
MSLRWPLIASYRQEIGYYRTGTWRTHKPVIEYGKCTSCMLCSQHCPDGLMEGKPPSIDYAYCKGCGICASICPAKAIRMLPEREALPKLRDVRGLLAPRIEKELVEVKWCGRGGEGVVTASHLLARAALEEGKHVQSIPEFGPERRGAPVRAYTRISDTPIYLRCAIQNPDILVLFHADRLAQEIKGLVRNGIVVINSPSPLRLKGVRTFWLDATQIALKVFGRLFVNTPMLGALAKATKLIGLEDLIKAIKERFSGRIAELNLRAVKVAYEQVSP